MRKLQNQWDDGGEFEMRIMVMILLFLLFLLCLKFDI